MKLQLVKTNFGAQMSDAKTLLNLIIIKQQ